MNLDGDNNFFLYIKVSLTNWIHEMLGVKNAVFASKANNGIWCKIPDSILLHQMVEIARLAWDV